MGSATESTCVARVTISIAATNKMKEKSMFKSKKTNKKKMSTVVNLPGDGFQRKTPT